MIVHVRAVYSVKGYDRAELERDCDRLMQTLLDFEKRDSSVRDAAVSVDLGRDLVEVEVAAVADDYDLAAKLARERIDRVVSAVTGRTPIYLHERHSELIDA